MNVRKLALTSTAIVALSGLTANGALADTTTGTASAEVVQAAVVTLTTAPSFGTLTVSGPGSATLAPGGGVTTGGDYSAADNGNNGVANITQSGGTVDITVALDDLVGTTGTDTLHATSLSVTGAAGTLTGTATTGQGSVTGNLAGDTLGGGETATLNIGAGVSDDGTAPGADTYQGTLTVTVNNS